METEQVNFNVPQTQTSNQIIEKKLPERDFTKVPKKKSVFVLWILSIITLGIYPGFWYLKRSPEFYNLGTKKRLSETLPLIFLIIIVVELAAIVVFPLTITEAMGDFYRYLSPLQIALIALVSAGIFLNILFSIILSFISRGIINEAILENKGISTKISGFFTLIFGFYYLQYEINRIMDDREDKPRTAPWIFFILVLILIAAAVYYGINVFGLV